MLPTLIALLLGLMVGAVGAWTLSRRQRAVVAEEISTEPTPLGDLGNPVERLAELANLTGGLAHEIRNPLSTLKVNLQLLSEEWRDVSEPGAEAVARRSLAKIDHLRTEVDRLQDILDDFLAYIGRQEFHAERVDINELVDDMVVFFRPQAVSKNVQVLTTLPSRPLECDVDVTKLKQALLNLFVNAQQAMPDGGELMVRTSAVAQCETDDVDLVPDQPTHACIEVIDTGSGISPDVVDRIFEPYFSTKKQGTGLGLPTTRRIVNAHGGEMEVHADPDQGSRFVIRLPLARPDPA